MNALSVKVKLNGYLGLLCISCYFGNAHMIFLSYQSCGRISLSAARNSLFSLSVPAVILR